MIQGLIYSALVLLFSACGSAEEPAVATAPSNSCPAVTAESISFTSANTLVQAQMAQVPADRFIVKLARGGEARLASAMEQETGGADLEDLDGDHFLLKLPQTATAEQIKEKFGELESIEPDVKVSEALYSNDPYLSKQWAHGKVHSSEAWDVSEGSQNVVVAVLDSGVDNTHPDLRDNIWHNPGEIAGNGKDDDGNGYIDDVYGWNFVANNNKPVMETGGSNHGTHVAGTIGAVGNNGIGISGHSPRVRIMALKFLGKDGSGYTSDAIKGINYAIRNGAKIINNSWGSYTRTQALSDAIDRARAAGILFVAAAGNSAQNNDSKPFYPSSFPQDNIVRVASSTSSDLLSSFSNYGAKTVDIAAPGSNIYSTVDGAKYATKSGTSMATPLISGVLATMVAARPGMSYAQIKGALLQSVDVLPAFRTRVRSGGRVNAYKALTRVTGLPADWQPPEIPSPCP